MRIMLNISGGEDDVVVNSKNKIRVRAYGMRKTNRKPQCLGSNVQVSKTSRNTTSARTQSHGDCPAVPVVRTRKRLSRVVIYGCHGRKALPVKVDKKGRLVTRPKIRARRQTLSFREQRYTVVAMDEFVPLPLEDISHAVQYVYLIHNMGDTDAQVFVQVGTDHENLADDLEGILTIQPNQTTVVTPLRFSKFVRLLYRCADPEKTTKLRIVFQAQIMR
ncbi:DUF6385 domain-containing protein [Alicyclobacillus macrosporangiidus]|uniref:DUF6385 domain-containing protein n=1 Tax=Alicyclobacillus macrosporangiidus TaxID=392015 RepID=UPI001113AEBA|nr:DUF6385 domain-containing protein [Alicyclobacillus macrosporangiidus]